MTQIRACQPLVLAWNVGVGSARQGDSNEFHNLSELLNQFHIAIICNESMISLEMVIYLVLLYVPSEELKFE